MSAPHFRRVKLTIEYDGGAYAGWQRQENALAVQQVLEEALSRLTGEGAAVTGASRTDAGVHALGQVAHWDTSTPIPDAKICYAVNTMLPPDIRVRDSERAEAEFHARYYAVGKTYRYQMVSSPHASALLRNSHAHVMRPLDFDKMREEAKDMLGTHDFAAFAASGSVVKNTVRTVHGIRLERLGDEIVLFVCGDGFLYNMVRILAGTLISVGTGKLEPGAISRGIARRDRLQLGVTAPPQGLTLMRVYYDEGELKKGISAFCQ